MTTIINELRDSTGALISEVEWQKSAKNGRPIWEQLRGLLRAWLPYRMGDIHQREQGMVSVTISGHRLRDKASVSGTLTFSDSDIATLRKYDDLCERLSRATIFVTGFPSVQNIRMEKGNGITITVSEFKESEVSEFLHIARPLILDREPASFKTTLAIYRRAFNETEFDGQVKYLYNLYVKGDYSGYVQFSTAGLDVFSDKMTQIWLNGGEYHQDEDKSQLVRQVESMLSEHSARGLFIAQLSGRVKAIDKLHSMVVGTLQAVNKK